MNTVRIPGVRSGTKSSKKRKFGNKIFVKKLNLTKNSKVIVRSRKGENLVCLRIAIINRVKLVIVKND